MIMMCPSSEVCIDAKRSSGHVGLHIGPKPREPQVSLCPGAEDVSQPHHDDV